MMKNGKHLSLHEATDKVMAVLNAEARGGRPTAGAARSPDSGSARGVGGWLAAQLGIPPEVAAPAGERGYAAMVALQQARDAGSSGVRGQHLAQAQRHMAKLDPARHGKLMRHLQGAVLALGGRGGDTEIAHVTPGEIVIPERLQTPEVLGALRMAALHQGTDPERLRIGSGRNAINPNTGQMEFDDSEPLPDTSVPDPNVNGGGPDPGQEVTVTGKQDNDDQMWMTLPDGLGIPIPFPRSKDLGKIPGINSMRTIPDYGVIPEGSLQQPAARNFKTVPSPSSVPPQEWLPWGFTRKI